LPMIAIDLKPTEMFFDGCRRVMDLANNVSDLPVGIEQSCAGHFSNEPSADALSS